MNYSFAPSHRTEWRQRLTWPQSAPPTCPMQKTFSTWTFSLLNGFKQTDFSYLSAKEKSSGSWIGTMNPVRFSESSWHSQLGWFCAQRSELLLGTGACQKPFPSLIHTGFLRSVSLEKDGGVLPMNSTRGGRPGWWKGKPVLELSPEQAFWGRGHLRRVRFSALTSLGPLAPQESEHLIWLSRVLVVEEMI